MLSLCYIPTLGLCPCSADCSPTQFLCSLFQMKAQAPFLETKQLQTVRMLRASQRSGPRLQQKTDMESIVLVTRIVFPESPANTDINLSRFNFFGGGGVQGRVETGFLYVTAGCPETSFVDEVPT